MRLRLRRKLDVPECLLSVFISPPSVRVGGDWGHTLRKYTTIRKPSNHIECTYFCVNVSLCLCRYTCVCVYVYGRGSNVVEPKARQSSAREGWQLMLMAAKNQQTQMKGHRRMSALGIYSRFWMGLKIGRQPWKCEMHWTPNYLSDEKSQTHLSYQALKFR